MFLRKKFKKGSQLIPVLTTTPIFKFVLSEIILRRFCKLLDLEFQDSMLHWTPIPEDQHDQFPPLGGAYKLAQKTSSFLASTSPVQVEQQGYDDVIVATAQKYMPIYQQFRELAIKV